MKEASASIHQKPTEEVLKIFESSADGLTKQAVEERRKKYGANTLPEPKRKTLLYIFFSQFLNPLIYVLIAAAILSIAADDVSDAIFIFIIIFINALLGTWQEWKAETNAAALKNLVKITSRVKREGRIEEIDAKDIVPGDVVLLESGVKVPADVRLVEVNGLAVEEALLTGESVPVEKSVDVIDAADPPIGDRVNMALAATTVIKGRGWGIAAGTALNTEIGKIAESLTGSEAEKPPLLNRMNVFSKRISILVIIICIILALTGWLRGMALMDIFFYMVAVGVAAIPEGLPIALTVALSIGTRRMARRNVIVRKLPAVEGLGSCTLIASDKTGTLTMDQQSVKKIVINENEMYEVTGQGYNGDGEIKDKEGNKIKDDNNNIMHLIMAGVLANEAILRKKDDGWEHSGDAVDVALRALAYKAGKEPKKFKEGVEDIKLVPYESEKKFSGAFFKRDRKTHFVMKGAAETVSQKLSADAKQFATDESEKMAAEGYRVLALAGAEVNDTNADRLPELNLLGLLGLIDPLREEAIPAIEKCHEAGIRVVMITGDHPATALTIARNLKIAKDENELMTGKQLSELEEKKSEDLSSQLKNKLVFARVSPLQKKLIIDSLKKAGHFAAVTGDGANDAPALKTAHIGVAMGSGTDLAKESASIIITDNNFASITSGIEEGRFTYDNLRKIIYLLISTGAAEILMVAVPLFLGMPLPFIAVQLLWLNLVTNGIQDISLAFEKGDPDVMQKPPRRPDEAIFNRLMNQQVVLSAVIMSIITIGWWWVMTRQPGFDETHARSTMMMLMVLMQNFHVLNCRSETRSIFKMPFSLNWVVLVGILLAQSVHISAAYIPGLNDVLQLQPVRFDEWLKLVPAAAIILIVMEIFKWIKRRRLKALPESNNVNAKAE